MKDLEFVKAVLLAFIAEAERKKNFDDVSLLTQAVDQLKLHERFIAAASNRAQGGG